MNTINIEIMKWMLFIAIFFTFLPTFCEDTNKLTQTLRGTISDKVTGLPLIGASVIISDTDPIRGTITDTYGNFRFEKVPIGRQSIEISYIGYHKMILPNLLLTTGKEVVINAKLEEKAYQVDETGNLLPAFV